MTQWNTHKLMAIRMRYTRMAECSDVNALERQADVCIG